MSIASDRMDSKLRVNMRLSVVEGLLAMPLVFFAMPGNFLLASMMTGAIGLKESVYGVIASLPAWANVVQLFALPWLTRRFSQKVICLVFSWIHLCCWVAVGYALPRIAMGGEWHSPLLIVGLFAVGALAFALVNVSWTSWVQEWLPTKGRGKYLGRRNRLLQISTVAFLVSSSWFLGYWKENAIFGFQMIIFVSVAMRAVSIVLQLRILPTKRVADERSSKLLDQFSSILKNTALIRFVVFGATFGFAANVMGPFFPVFYYKVLGMSVEEVARLAMLATTTGALMMPFWGRVCDKYGCRISLMVALSVWMGTGYLHQFARPDEVGILYLIWGIGGVAGSGFLFGSFSMILKLIPAEAKTAAISFNLAASSLSAAVAPILGGLLFSWVQARFQDQVGAFHVISLVHHSVVISTGILLLGIAEPKAATLTQAIGAMRPLRQLGTLMGVSFLANYSFFRKGEEEQSEEGERN
ncbi:MFS transporter [Pelagicoccus sp. NFK12]|uniref:MFS transporter n=1 Tax=Pelagicoccus enzymogenes TaxID=2773457 RepID=A0A927IG28_9BACT|nr:MFS transporter [Pelagicoccus enzymogenes]MBD5778711.1 MFS transporter [Pelagicoccus enzymogenes]MDQ8197542.1 MFS transporter [Pelagicoccus enzymogenes]